MRHERLQITTNLYKAKILSISSAGIASFAFMLFLLLQVIVIPIRFPGVNIAIAIEFAIAGVMSVGLTSLIGGDEEEHPLRRPAQPTSRGYLPETTRFRALSTSRWKTNSRSAFPSGSVKL